MKITINNEEVLCDKNIKITEEMLNTSSTILNNVYPKTWETTHDYTQYYYPKDYSQCLIWGDKYRDVTIGGIGIQKSPNSFDKNNPTIINAFVNGNTGLLTSPTNNQKSIVVKVNANSTYDISGVERSSSNYGLYSDNELTVGTSIATAYGNINNGSRTITTGANTKWLVFLLKGGVETYGYDNVKVIERVSPSNPIPIETITGKTNIEIPKGKNLWRFIEKDFYQVGNATYKIINQDTLQVSTVSSGTYRNVKFILNIPDGTYTFSVGSITNSNTSFSNNRVEISYFTNGTRTILTNFNNNTPRTITIENQPGRQYVLEFWASLATSITNTATFSNVQIEKGNTKTDFESYQGQEYPIDFGNYELCYISNCAADRLYNSGENWYIVKNIGKTVLDGTENWTTRGGGTIYAYQVSNYFGGNATYGLCDYFWFYRSGASNSQAIECMASASTTTALCIFTNNSNLSTVDSLKTWLSENKPVLYYQLATPTTTQITDENLINQLNVLIKDLLFSGVAKRTGNISLNPFHAHYCDLQILDYKALLSEGDMLDFVIADKTVEQAIDMVIDAIKDYGFIKGNIEIPDNFKMGTYNTQEKTAYDVFQYISDITQTKWTTRVINQNTVAIDFFNPYDKAPIGTIDSTKEYFKENNIVDISYNYSTEDYRNKQVLTSNEVVSSITQTFRIRMDGVNKTYDLGLAIGDISYAYYVTSTDFVICDIITKAQQEQGYSGDIIYTPGESIFETDDLLAEGVMVDLDVNLLVPGRQIAMNDSEIQRIGNQNNRKGVISRYENRDDTTSSIELQRIAQSYIEYKGKAEIELTVKTQNKKLCNVGDVLIYNSSIEDLSDNYMCKSIETEMIMTTGDIFYTFIFTNTYNTENAINYFDNQRNKTLGNISDGETITRNLDIENSLDIVFFDSEVI